MTLPSLDLFTGIGGFTLALSGWATPVAYCDNNTGVIATLESLMKKKRLPTAPVLSDVRDVEGIKRAVASSDAGRVGIVTAGFPCVGFSTAGSKQGLDNDESALFYDAVRVVAALKPDMVMFENVKALLSHSDDMKAICKTMRGMGYDLAWTVVSAADLGAPHKRARWFCLCVRRGYKCPPLTASQTDAFRWKRRPDVVTKFSPGDSRALSMLGNAIVPDCARLAFARLYTGFSVHLTIPRTIRRSAFRSNEVREPISAWPVHGAMSLSGKLYAANVALISPVPMNIVVDPNHYRPTVPYKQSWRPNTPKFGSTDKRTFWPTPRAGSATHTSVMTARTKNDLATAAMFASYIEGKKQPRPKETYGINVAFVEWLMGYPRGHSRGM